MDATSGATPATRPAKVRGVLRAAEEEVPLACLPGNAMRIRVKAAGELELAGRA